MRMKFKDYLEEETTTGDAATTSADIAKHKKRIGGDYGKQNQSALVLRIKKNRQKMFDFLKDLANQYQDRGVTISTGLDQEDEGVVQINAPVHLIDELKSKVEKKNEIEVQ